MNAIHARSQLRYWPTLESTMLLRWGESKQTRLSDTLAAL